MSEYITEMTVDRLEEKFSKELDKI